MTCETNGVAWTRRGAWAILDSEGTESCLIANRWLKIKAIESLNDGGIGGKVVAGFH
jgi:hypothetical protein